MSSEHMKLLSTSLKEQIKAMEVGIVVIPIISALRKLKQESLSLRPSWASKSLSQKTKTNQPNNSNKK
jgi:hypothetical protein